MLSAVGVALAGALHCVGMCGVFASAMTNQPFAKAATYFSAKTLTYVVIGLLAGALGGWFVSFTEAQGVLAILVGLVLIVQGAAFLFDARLGSVSRGGSKFSSFFSTVVGRLMKFRSPLALGLANGLLPCGLVYTAAALAVASGSAIGGAMVMTTFGLATIPSLAVLPIILRRARLTGRKWKIAGGIVLILAGLLTPLRGITSHGSAPSQQMHHDTSALPS